MTICNRTFKLTAALPVFASLPEACCNADHGSTLHLGTPCTRRGISSLSALPPPPLTEIAEDSGPLRLFASLVMSRYGSGQEGVSRRVPE